MSKFRVRFFRHTHTESAGHREREGEREGVSSVCFGTDVLTANCTIFTVSSPHTHTRLAEASVTKNL